MSSGSEEPMQGVQSPAPRAVMKGGEEPRRMGGAPCSSSIGAYGEAVRVVLDAKRTRGVEPLDRR